MKPPGNAFPQWYKKFGVDNHLLLGHRDGRQRHLAMHLVFIVVDGTHAQGFLTDDVELIGGDPAGDPEPKQVCHVVLVYARLMQL